MVSRDPGRFRTADFALPDARAGALVDGDQFAAEADGEDRALIHDRKAPDIGQHGQIADPAPGSQIVRPGDRSVLDAQGKQLPDEKAGTTISRPAAGLAAPSNPAVSARAENSHSKLP